MDQVVVVTGVTSGLGRTVARRFAEAGDRVIGMGRRAELGESLARETPGVTFVPGDVSRVDDCRCLIDRAIEDHGRVDTLINNAGTVGSRPVADSHTVTEELWDEVVDTNLKGAFFCSRFALEPMTAQRSGLILNIASINAVNPLARMQAYNVSKAGLVHLGQGLAVEYRDVGIRVNTIILGGVSDGVTGDETRRAITEYLTGVAPDADADHPKGKNSYTSDDVASALLALCGPECSIITGATIAIDGAVSAGLLASKFLYQPR
jgi:NAD(P)-dependent dehydrogenase (short-subunit alcohol dehydrogenase family)